MLIPLIYNFWPYPSPKNQNVPPGSLTVRPPKNDGWKKTFLLGFGNFFSAIIVSFREGSWHRLHTALTFLDGLRLHNPTSTFGHQGTGSVHPRHVLRSSALPGALRRREPNRNRRKSDDCIGSPAWNPKQPFINGCFNWMIPNLYIENGCFTKHPFINGCLGFQVVKRQKSHPNHVSANIIKQKTGWGCHLAVGILNKKKYLSYMTYFECPPVDVRTGV